MKRESGQSEKASARGGARSVWAGLGLAAVLALVPGAPARAQDEYGRSGLYLGGSWMRAAENFKDDLDDELEAVLPDAVVDTDIDDFQSVGVVLGWRASPRWSLELVGERYRDVQIDVVSGGALASADLQLRTALLMTKFFVLTGPIQPYLMAGFGALQARVESGGLSDRGHSGIGRAGLGLDLYLTPNLVLGLQASYSRAATSEFNDVSFFSAGANAMLRF